MGGISKHCNVAGWIRYFRGSVFGVNGRWPVIERLSTFFWLGLGFWVRTTAAATLLFNHRRTQSSHFLKLRSL
jgi:hypothetical protein